MILRLVIADSSTTPAVAESVEVAADGTISGWRSVGDNGVGWFAGRLPADELATIEALVSAVDAPPPPVPAPPGAGQEVLELPATGPFSIAGLDDPLSGAARQLLTRLTDFPRAAVTVRHVAPGVARLSHRGADPLRLDLGTLAVRATGWRGYYEPAGDRSTTVSGPGELEAGPGWTYDVPFDQPPGDDVTIHLTVDLAVLSGPTRVPVQAQHI